MRRFTRLPNGFSKKVESLAHAFSLAPPLQLRPLAHGAEGALPAHSGMAGRGADHVWSREEIAALLD
jgi:hypothetical protein